MVLDKYQLRLEENDMKPFAAMFAISIVTCVTPTVGFAQSEKPPGCIDANVPKSSVAERGGAWTALTSGQWQFLRGIYAMNPNTPAGLPYGDGAALAQVEGNADGLVFFIDGDRACSPMVIPHELVDVLHDIANGKIEHDLAGL
jgi:hypothetical protein